MNKIKKDNFVEWYINIITSAKIIDYAPVKGFIALRPNGYFIWELIKNKIDVELKKTGHANAFLPVLIPEDLLSKEKSHFTGFNPEVFWVTHSGNSKIGKKLALRPTSETLAYFFYSKWIQSWRDLPLKINFWNSALRAEIKDTKPFLRTSEFLWQEGHTAHSTKIEAEEEVHDILNMYKKIIEKELAIPIVIGKKSDKEKFVGAVYTLTLESLMPDGKALQMGTSHFLGQNFAKAFEIKFSNVNNKDQYVWQTSWGISWRLIGAVIMIHGDNDGMVLPPSIAPIQIVIIPIYYNKKDMKKILIAANNIKKNILTIDANIRIHVDDREDITPGFKFNDWELKGVPIRLEIGPQELNKKNIILFKRYNKKKSSIKLKKLNHINNILENIQNTMLCTAKKWQNENIINIYDYNKFKIQLKKGGFIVSPWCGNKKCESSIKEETGADIRVIPFINNKKKPRKCIYCDQKSTTYPIFANGY